MSDYGPYYAIVTDEHDGDTMGLNIDLGFKQAILAFNPITGKRQFSCRLYGIDAPEILTGLGKEALAWLKDYLPVGSQVVIMSKDWDAYQGRYDAVIWKYDPLLGQRQVQSVNDLMVLAGHAVYKGF